MGYILQDLSNIATQAALVAGFVYSSVAESSATTDDRIGEAIVGATNSCTIVVNLVAVTTSTFVMTSGPYQALTGDEQTLWRTLRSLQRERRRVIAWYWGGLTSFFFSLIFSVVYGEWNYAARTATVSVAVFGMVEIRAEIDRFARRPKF